MTTEHLKAQQAELAGRLAQMAESSAAASRCPDAPNTSVTIVSSPIGSADSAAAAGSAAGSAASSSMT